MNINLIYEGKNYNFDIPNNVTMDYLKELSSKIFNSEKDLLDIIYKNKKITDNSDNTLIRDLIPEGESNAILTVQINKNNNNKSILKRKKERKKSYENLKKKNSIEEINIEKINNINNRYDQIKEKNLEKNIEKINQNQKDKDRDSDNNKNENTILENIYSNNNNNNLQSKIRLMLNNSNKLNLKDMNKKEKFINAYIQKYGDLLSLIRKFSDKVKKIYLLLYHKYKINNRNSSHNTSLISRTTKNENIINNSMDSSFYELALYEKKIMNFLENQIIYYKSLLESLQNYDNDINYSKLTAFYKKLFLFKSENNNSNIKKIKEIINRNKIFNNNKSSVNLTSFKSNNNNKLPSIKIKNLKSPLIKETQKDQFLSELKIIPNLNPINNIKEINSKQKELKENKLQKNINKKNNINNIEEEDISSNNNSKKMNILDNISEKYSFESNTEKNDHFEDIRDVSPIRLNKNKNEIDNNINIITPIKSFQKKDSSILNTNKHKNSVDKKVSIDLDLNQIKKDKKVKEINISSMTVKDSNFSLEKNFNQNKKNSINKYDYVM